MCVIPHPAHERDEGPAFAFELTQYSKLNEFTPEKYAVTPANSKHGVPVEADLQVVLGLLSLTPSMEEPSSIHRTLRLHS